MPCTPASWSASFTSSSLKGLMTASIFFMLAFHSSMEAVRPRARWAAAFGQVGVLSIAFPAAPRSRARGNGMPKEWAPLHRRAPFPRGVDAPRLQAGLGDDGAAAFGDRDQVGENP